ncbi:helix-turn-helix domain-containing protein [Citrobacter amalonaticus]|uniref:helix-turn-helix domain-containing protein n=1 Tax=Citrobacter amalonaticus TaxID=35703 RepID=UPI0039B4603D
MKPKYSLEFRHSVVKFYLAGNGARRTGSKFGVNRDTVSQWVPVRYFTVMFSTIDDAKI